ncbi:hypothetical protein ACJJTC_013558 [Scirpophaga incertulas]
MFGMRTPTKPGGTRDRPSTSPGVPAATNKTTTKGTDAAGIAKRKVTARTKTPDPAPRSSLTGLMARALKLLNETKSQMDQSGNIKGSIKTTVLKNVQSLYELVRESEEKRETERRERESPTPFTPTPGHSSGAADNTTDRGNAGAPKPKCATDVRTKRKTGSPYENDEHTDIVCRSRSKRSQVNRSVLLKLLWREEVSSECSEIDVLFGAPVLFIVNSVKSG